MMDFLENQCFIDNIQSKNINTIRWGSDDEFYIERQSTSFIATKRIEDDIARGQDEEDLVISEIDTKIMPVSWIFNSHSGMATSFKDFIRCLRNVENDKVFGLEFTKYLVENVWPDYQQQVIRKIFYPFVIHMVLVHAYFMFLCERGEDHKAFNFGQPEFWMRNVLIVLVFYFLKTEVLQLINDGWDYFYDPYNYFNNISLLM